MHIFNTPQSEDRQILNLMNKTLPRSIMPSEQYDSLVLPLCMFTIIKLY